MFYHYIPTGEQEGRSVKEHIKMFPRSSYINAKNEKNIIYNITYRAFNIIY